MLINIDTTANRELPYPRELVWQVIAAMDPAAGGPASGVRRVEGPRHDEVGSSHIMELPATAPDGLPAIWLTTITQISPGHMFSTRAVGPLLEQREAWTLEELPAHRCRVIARAWVQASAAVYTAEGLEQRTSALLNNALNAVAEHINGSAA